MTTTGPYPSPYRRSTSWFWLLAAPTGSVSPADRVDHTRVRRPRVQVQRGARLGGHVAAEGLADQVGHRDERRVVQPECDRGYRGVEGSQCGPGLPWRSGS